MKCTQLAGTDATTTLSKNQRHKIPKSYRSNTAMMNDSKNNDTARKKREDKKMTISK